MTTDLARRLQKAREEAGYATVREAADALGVPYPTYAGHENGSSGFRAPTGEMYARRFRVSFEWLMRGKGPMAPKGERLAPVVGKAAAATDGQVVFAEGQEGLGMVQIPEGASPDSVAIEIEGYSMGFLADGALIFYTETHSAPTTDMLGQIVIVGTDTGEVLLKRLLRGSEPGLYDLESINGPTLRDRRVNWAAHVDSIVPPWRAARLRVDAGPIRL